MTTNKQIKANQVNASKWWVKTTQWKEIVSQNAIKHWITSQRILWEEKVLYETIFSQLVEETTPEGYLELMLCERIAFHQMKLIRLVTLESVTIETQPLKTEVQVLEKTMPKQSIQLLDLDFWELSYSSPKQEKIANQYQSEIGLLRKKIKDIEANTIHLWSLDMLERFQRYSTDIENRLFKSIREYQRIKDLKKGKPIIEVSL